MAPVEFKTGENLSADPVLPLSPVLREIEAVARDSRIAPASIAKNFTDLWDQVIRAVCSELDDPAVCDRVRTLRFVSFEAGTLTLGAPTRFARDRMRGECGKILLREWQAVRPSVIAVSVIAGGQVASAFPAPVILQSVAPASEFADQEIQSLSLSLPQTEIIPPDRKTDTEIVPEQIYDSAYDRRFTFENFVIGASNELAYSAAKKVASGLGVSFNPLFFHGGVGIGKTHLMHSIAKEAKILTPERKTLYLSAEQFMHRFVNALRNYDMEAFKNEFRNVDLLLIDDLQFIAGKNGTQEEFFHTFNALIDGKKQIVLSADRCPGDMDYMEDRIKSRLSWGLVANIHQTDFSLRKAVLVSKIKLLQNEYPGFFVPEKVIEFVALRITGNIRELEGAVNRLAAHASFTGRPVTLEVTEEVIADMLRYAERKLSVQQIQRRTAEFYQVNLQDMLSARRARDVARPRQVAMYLTKHLTNLSLPDIGRRFGGRDHSTVLHSCKRIEELLESDADFTVNLQKLIQIIKHS